MTQHTDISLKLFSVLHSFFLFPKWSAGGHGLGKRALVKKERGSENKETPPGIADSGLCNFTSQHGSVWKQTLLTTYNLKPI